MTKTNTYRIRLLTELITDSIKLKFSKTLILKYKTELKTLQAEVTKDRKKAKRLSKIIIAEKKYNITFIPTKPLTFSHIFSDIGYKTLREQRERKELKELARRNKLKGFFRSVSIKENNAVIPTNEEILKVKA